MSSTKNNVRKKLFSKNNKNTVNKKISTGDKDEQAVSNNNTPLGVSTKTKQMQMEIKENQPLVQELNLEELQKNTIKLEEELNTLKNKYESEHLDNIGEIKTINVELKEKNEESKNIAKENKKILTKLKTLENRLNEKFQKIINIKLIKRRTTNKISEKQLSKEIELKEKLINNMKKNSERNKLEQEKYENLLKEAEKGESEKIKELEYLNELIEEAEVEHEDLKMMKLEHNNCYKEIQNLTSTLNLLHNEIEFEKKKNMMLMANKNIDNKIYEESNDELYLLQKNSLLTPKEIYSKRVRDLILLKSIPKVEKINKSTIKYIQQEFDLINKKKKVNNYLSRRNLLEGNNHPTSVLDDIYVPPTNLFTERETEVLTTIVPESSINEYMGKFEEKKKEVDEIQELFGENDEIKNENIEMKFEIDTIKMKIKTKEIIRTNLMNKYRKNNRKIIDIKKEISEIENKIQEKEVILNRLNRINKNYTDIYNKAQKIK